MKLSKKIFTRTLISFAGLFLISFSSSWAATVSKIKGKKILIELEGEPAQKGQVYYLMGSDGKKKGILKILSIKGDKAIAQLGKGKATKGDSLMARESSSESKKGRSSRAQNTSSSSGSPSSHMGWGLLLGMGMDSMSVELDSTPVEKVNLVGKGMSYKAMFDYALFERIWFRGTAGMENFTVEGDTAKAACDNKVCSVNIQYMTLDFWGRYLFSLSGFRSWLGAGFTLWFPMSKQTTALQESSITNTSVMAIGGGFDWYINHQFYIPLQAEYGLLPASDQVNASAISVRAGIGMNF